MTETIDWNKIKRISEIFSKNKRELNFFDTAFHKYYENPTTELIAFFLGKGKVCPEEISRNFFKKIIANLCDNCSDKNNDEFNSLNIHTQISTPEGKIIDLILETKNLYIVFECKVDAELYNPLTIYSNYALKESNGKKNFIWHIL